MVHSVELLVDDATDAAVREIWADLHNAELPSRATHTAPSNRPHVTVAVGERLADAADAELAEVTGRLPLPCRLGAPLVFGHGRMTLALLVVPSADLLDLHRQVHRICLPHMASGLYPHAAPGHWTPHVTLARRVRHDQIAAALDLAAAHREIVGAFTGLRHWDGDAKSEYPITM
ncbi:2'-5' RNA ligase family protein [Mycobacterium sp. C31M]